jgi:hypothetical protein
MDPRLLPAHFPSPHRDPGTWAQLYQRFWTSPLYKNNSRHESKLAF